MDVKKLERVFGWNGKCAAVWHAVKFCVKLTFGVFVSLKDPDGNSCNQIDDATPY